MSNLIKGIGNAILGGAQTGVGDLVSGAIKAPLQMALQGWGAKKQYEYNKKLQEQAAKYNNWLAEQSAARNYNYGLKMFNATGYEAQKAQMKAAGLNPALMYQSGGQAGTTANPSSGSAEGVNAQGMQGMSMNITSNPAVAQTAADINLKNAQADELRSRIPKNEADTDLAKAAEEKEKQYKEWLISDTNLNWAKEYNVGQEGIKLMWQAYDEQLKYKVHTATAAQEVVQSVILTQSMVLGNMLTESNIDLNEYQKIQITETLAQGWQSLWNDIQRIGIEKFNAMTNRDRNRIYEKQVDNAMEQFERNLDFEKHKFKEQVRLKTWELVNQSIGTAARAFKDITEGGTNVMDMLPVPKLPRIGFNK